MYLKLMKCIASCMVLGFYVFLLSCGVLNSNEDQPSQCLGAITVNNLYVEQFDKYIYGYDSLDGSPHSHYYSNYMPKHDSLQIKVNPYIRTVKVDIEEFARTSRYISYVFKFTTSTDKYNRHYDDSFFLDIYDCDPPYCKNASQVVFYSIGHIYMEVFAKGEFSITEPSYNRFLKGKDTDGCTLNVYKNYRLVLKNERIDMDIEFQDLFFYCDRSW